MVKPGFRLFWIHEKDNQYDPNAIRVYADPAMRVDLGHLSREMASKVVVELQEGKKMELYCMQITGGKAGKSNGMNIKIVFASS